jgi:hypothetical protein
MGDQARFTDAAAAVEDQQSGLWGLEKGFQCLQLTLPADKLHDLLLQKVLIIIVCIIIYTTIIINIWSRWTAAIPSISRELQRRSAYSLTNALWFSSSEGVQELPYCRLAPCRCQSGFAEKKASRPQKRPSPVAWHFVSFWGQNKQRAAHRQLPGGIG